MNIEDRIARIDVPEADPQARRRAFAAALASYDDATANNSAKDPKETHARRGLISTILGKGTEMSGRGRLMAGTAAALVLAVPLTVAAVRGIANNTIGFDAGSVSGESAVGGPAPQGKPRPERSEIGAIAEGSKTTRTIDPITGIDDALGLGGDAADAVLNRPATKAPSIAVAESISEAERARQLAIVEAMRLGPGQISGNARTGGFLPPEPFLPLPEAGAGDSFAGFDTSPSKLVAHEPVSTFSVDVDTASYSYVRRSIETGVLPSRDAVRVEEMINYFPYSYHGPDSADVPFRANVSVVDDPWRPGAKLMHVGIKGWEVPAESRPPASVVLLVDTSGSMESPDKLPLLQASLRLMAKALDDRDVVSIVTYAGSSTVALEPTSAKDRSRIVAAIDSLSMGGGTAGADGLRTAYDLAERSKIPGGVSRVVLATDGDFNVGISDPAALEDFIARKRSTGVFLSVLGFGAGNLGDDTMQALAQNGNGTAAYIDGLSEARKVLVEQIGSSVLPIAGDMKIQVEFNPAVVSEYRLVGYETRALARDDFKDDLVDAGDIGSGHAVTAIYEIVPVGSPAARNDPLRYGVSGPDSVPAPSSDPASSEYAFVKIRYKLPGGDVSRLVETPVTATGNDLALDRASDDVRFSLAVAVFGGRLRDGTGPSYGEIAAMAEAALGTDPGGYRHGFVRLVRNAEAISPR